MRIYVSGQQKHLFYKMDMQMHHFKVEPSQCDVWPSFAYLRTCVVGQRNHSLITFEVARVQGYLRKSEGS